MIVFRILTTLLVLGLTVAPASATDPDPIADAESRGAAIFAYDKAAWLTTDDGMQRLPKERGSEIGGWVVTPAGDGLAVSYFGRGDHADRVIYSGTVTNGNVHAGTVFSGDDRPYLTSEEQLLKAALEVAREALNAKPDWRSCSTQPFNTVAIPNAGDGSVSVYFLTPQTNIREFPFGGHFRIDVAPNGTVIAKRRFTNSCITLSSPDDDQSEHVVALALAITHVLDPQPTEIHVFEQLTAATCVFVRTADPKATWSITDGKIRRLPN